MRNLIILGATVHGGEMAEMVERVNAVKPTWNLLGFVVSKVRVDRVGTEHDGHPVLGCADVLAEFADACVVPAFGYDDPIDVDEERLVSLIDPSAFVSHTATIGRGCVIYPNCFVGRNAVLGDRVFVLANCVINHDDRVGHRVTLASGVVLAGQLHIGADCYLGQTCTIRQDVHVGENCLIGMGCVVIRDVPPDSVMVGNPGRRLRGRAPPSLR